MDKLLALFDLEFIVVTKDYVTKMVKYAKKTISDHNCSTPASGMESASRNTEQTPDKTFLKIRVVADICNLCVAIVNSGNTKEPQALQLKVEFLCYDICMFIMHMVS